MVVKVHEAAIMVYEKSQESTGTSVTKKLLVSQRLTDDLSLEHEADVIVHDYGYYDELKKLPEEIKQKMFLLHDPDCKITAVDLDTAIEEHKFRGFLTSGSEIRM